MRTIHYLHIGKTAGTQIKHVIDQINAAGQELIIKGHGHGVRLADLPRGAAYFFSVRRPESRFKSAFYSRKRKGLPRYNVEWSPHERELFERFEHANDLAEALFENSQRGFEAFCAMNSSPHFMPQMAWFANCGFFFRLRPPIAVLRQEKLGEDLGRLVRTLGVGVQVSLTEDPTLAHRNAYEGVPELSAKARQNLSLWFAQDYLFYDYCSAWIEQERVSQAKGKAAAPKL